MTVQLTGQLTRHQLAVLVVGSRLHTWTRQDAPVRIYEALGLGEMRFRQEIGAVLRHPAAEAFDPITVRRLRRLQGESRRGRRESAS